MPFLNRTVTGLVVSLVLLAVAVRAAVGRGDEERHPKPHPKPHPHHYTRHPTPSGPTVAWTRHYDALQLPSHAAIIDDAFVAATPAQLVSFKSGLPALELTLPLPIVNADSLFSVNHRFIVYAAQDPTSQSTGFLDVHSNFSWTSGPPMMRPTAHPMLAADHTLLVPALGWVKTEEGHWLQAAFVGALDVANGTRLYSVGAMPLKGFKAQALHRVDKNTALWIATSDDRVNVTKFDTRTGHVWWVQTVGHAAVGHAVFDSSAVLALHYNAIVMSVTTVDPHAHLASTAIYKLNIRDGHVIDHHAVYPDRSCRLVPASLRRDEAIVVSCGGAPKHPASVELRDVHNFTAVWVRNVTFEVDAVRFDANADVIVGHDVKSVTVLRADNGAVHWQAGSPHDQNAKVVAVYSKDRLIVVQNVTDPHKGDTTLYAVNL